MQHATDNTRIAVVIPCFRVKDFILGVLSSIPANVEKIFLIDDACPEHTGEYVRADNRDARVEIIINPINNGVGGAVIQGYRRALAENYGIIVKIDGDGQMDGGDIPRFVAPIISGQADYVKGNRFRDWRSLHHMPKAKLLCNVALSFISILSTGYWNSADPVNGFTAIRAETLSKLSLDKIARDYFFESDMLFWLNRAGARMINVPVRSRYNARKTGLVLSKNIIFFAKGHAQNIRRRLLRLLAR